MRYRRELLSFSIPLLSDLTNWMTFARTVILGSGEHGVVVSSDHVGTLPTS